MRSPIPGVVFTTVIALSILFPETGLGQRKSFSAPGENLGVWRLTFEPTARDWANYHNTRCFSPDGRYVCFTRYHGASGKSEARIHVYDLHEDRDREIGPGVFPRWARHHNWLIFARYNFARGKTTLEAVETVLLDLTSGRETVLADDPGAETIGETTHDDRWLIAASRHRGEKPEYHNVRISLPDGDRIEALPEVFGAQRMTNPRHARFFTRSDHGADPFAGTRFWFDLEGNPLGIAAPTLQKCHMSWSGDGEYLLLGNGLIRGRRWNEPFPSNVHILARVSVGDISPCGDSGRWVCGDATLADLRSGDGWSTVEPHSLIAFPAAIGDNSGIYDADPKGSPDGTKICFVTNYPIERGSVTHVIEANGDAIEVESTEGFPEKGRLSKRDYFDRGDRLVSREHFDAMGFVTEQIHFIEGPDGPPQVRAHWFFDHGIPVRHVHGSGGRSYEKRGDRWGRVDNQGTFIDLPRGSNSE